LQGASYSGMRLTRQTDWIMGAPADYTVEEFAAIWGSHDPMQPMRQGSVQHEDWAHSRSTAALDQGFLNGDVAPSRLGRVVGDDHFGPATVYQRTYPAGVVSMHGNTGGAGSYLTFVGNPTAPTAPCVSVFEWALPSDWSISATSSWDANYQPDSIKVHDGNPWHSGRANILPQDLFFDAGQEVTLSGFATAHPNGWAGSAMQGYTLSRSDDGLNFIEIVSGTGTNLANSERQEFEFDAVTSQHWRLHMTSNYGYHNFVTAQYVEFRSETCVQEANLGSPTLRNGNLEEGFSTAIFEYTNTIAGWAASGGTVSCRSGNAPWGGITSSEGNYYVALQSRGAAIQQAVDGHVTGHSYTLRVSAAQRQNGPGGRGAILKITVGVVELLNEQITSASFVQREVTYTATQSTEVIRFENIVGDGDQTIFVDDIQIDA
jgi:hypothetical protein